jgi:hypothetical protein
VADTRERLVYLEREIEIQRSAGAEALERLSERERWAVEVKLTSDPSPHDLARLDKCAAMVGDTRAILVSRVPRDAGDAKRLSCGIDRLLREVRSLAR